MAGLVDQSWLTQAAPLLCHQVDWNRPSLAGTSAHKAFEQGRLTEAALLLVRHLRSRETPRLPCSLDYVQSFRQAATQEQRNQARQRLLEALRDRAMSQHTRGAFRSCSTEQLHLIDDPELFDAMGPILTARAQEDCSPAYEGGEWGTAYSLFRFVAALWPIPECRDEVFIPLLAIIGAQTRIEWPRARSWDDAILGTASHNWWLTTFTGLWANGTFFPELKGLASLRELAPVTLERCILLLFRDDGFTREQSGYHFGSVDHALEWVHLAQLNGITVSQQALKRLRDAAAAFWKILTPDGDFPHFGDGYVGVRHEPPIPERLRSLAAWLNLGEVKYLDQLRQPDWRPPHDGMLPLHGCNMLPAYEALEPVPAPLDIALPTTQWYTMRSDWTTRAHMAAFDASPRGKAGTSHAHNALLNLVLYSHGRPVLLDNGAGPYGKTQARWWRMSSAAHNVATVDELDHLDKVTEWRFRSQEYPIVDTWVSEPEYAYLASSHEAYTRLPIDVDRVGYCRRKLFFLRGRYWILTDRFTRDWWSKPASHHYDVHFHLPAPVSLDDAGCAWTAGEGGNLLIVPVPGLNGQAMVEPCPHPLEGYDNPDHLRYRLTTEQNVILTSLLIPFEGSTRPQVKVESLEVRVDQAVVEPREITALRIHVDGESHLYVEQHMQWTQPWEVDGVTGSARVYHSAVKTPM